MQVHLHSSNFLQPMLTSVQYDHVVVVIVVVMVVVVVLMIVVVVVFVVAVFVVVVFARGAMHMFQYPPDSDLQVPGRETYLT